MRLCNIQVTLLGQNCSSLAKCEVFGKLILGRRMVARPSLLCKSPRKDSRGFSNDKSVSDLRAP